MRICFDFLPNAPPFRKVSYYYQAYDWLGKLTPDKLSPRVSKWCEGGGSQKPLESGQAVFISSRLLRSCARLDKKPPCYAGYSKLSQGKLPKYLIDGWAFWTNWNDPYAGIRTDSKKPPVRAGGFSVAPAPISSRFFCPRPPLLLNNQNRHATQAKVVSSIAVQFSDKKRFIWDRNIALRVTLHSLQLILFKI